MIRAFLFSATLLSLSILNAAGHNSQGSNYGNQGVLAYEVHRHGVDGALFLDPFFLKALENIQNKLVLDAGCGSGPWSIYCANKGATVFGIDLQTEMIERARNASWQAGVEKFTQFTVGTVSDLPYESDLFDLALSINVGCNLPSSVLSQHIHEMFRCLTPGGKAVITAPDSFGIVFTTNIAEGSVYDHIDQVLALINQDLTPPLHRFGAKQAHRSFKRHFCHTRWHT